MFCSVLVNSYMKDQDRSKKYTKGLLIHDSLLNCKNILFFIVRINVTGHFWDMPFQSTSCGPHIGLPCAHIKHQYRIELANAPKRKIFPYVFYTSHDHTFSAIKFMMTWKFNHVSTTNNSNKLSFNLGLMCNIILLKNQLANI
jgi:hypothetical protein